ncbi:MAG: alkaline phosphatase family protein [Candidatus Acidiferrum sp.]
MIRKSSILVVLLAALAGASGAQEKDKPQGVPHLDHVFVIMMENHGYQQIYKNPNAAYLNSLISNKQVNLATNYFAVGHPSLTNYLEIVGGSNFGIRSDNNPNWGSTSCTPNLQSHAVNADNYGGNPPSNITVESGPICPIAGSGMDADTPAVDNWNEVNPPEFNFLADINGIKSVPASDNIQGKTIADQLVHNGLSWKSYQEDLPVSGANGVNWASENGTVSNLTDFTDLAPITSSSVVQTYAVKHNPFAYFQNVQEGNQWNNSLQNTVGFDGPLGLYADLGSGDVPSLAFIAPSQCHDDHGRQNGDAFCAYDGNTDGTQLNLNPGLIQQGDVTIQKLVESIKHSPVWHEGRTAIVIVWDENDYSGSATQSQGLFPPQNQNTVVLTVETNCDKMGVQSSKYYNSFSLLRSLEAGFGLPCLNHACDPGVSVMSDLFGGH